MTRECFILLSIMMNSTNDKSRDVQNFLKIIKEKGKEKDMQDMLNKMTTTEKVDNFLQQNQINEFMGGEQTAMHDYQKDPELIKTLQEIINVPGYDPDSVKEAQRQMLRIRQGLPRFPKA